MVLEQFTRPYLPGGFSHPLETLLKRSATPAESQCRLAEGLPVQRLEPLSSARVWDHADGHLPAGSLDVVAIVGSPYLLETSGNGHAHPLIVLGHGGHAALTIGSKCFDLQSEKAVILPGQRWKLCSEQGCSATLIPFDPLRLVTTARAMAPGSWEPPPSFDSPLSNGLSLPSDGDDQCSALVIALNLLLPAFVQVGMLGESFLDAFLLDQQLYRLIAALAFPSLRNHQPTPLPNAASTDRRLERVLDFIGLNLDQPLSLSVLVEQSNYSRRSIHYAFQERFNCSPMQWIRQQRMILAMQRLQESQSGRTTVRAIAAECGYNSLGRFYVDFQRAYGCRPSAVLRGMALNGLQSRRWEAGVEPHHDVSPNIPLTIQTDQPPEDAG